MTRKEWVKEHYPNSVSAKFQGGVQFCPKEYFGLANIDPVVKEFSNLSVCMRADNNCYRCWNEEIPNTEKEKEMNQTTNTGIIGGNPLPCSSCEYVLICKFSAEMAEAQEAISRLCKEHTAFAGNFIKPIKVECYHYKTHYQATLTRDWVNPCENGPSCSTANQTRQEKINRNMAENYGD